MEFLVIIVSVLALLFALIQGISITRVKVTDEKIIKIGGYIRSGAMAYLKRQYKILSVYVAVVAIILFILPGMGILTTAAFLLGTIFSVTAGFFGMKAATSANMRTTQAAKSGLQEAFKFAFSGGSVMGLSVVGLGALGISVLYLIFKDVTILTGFSFGASSIALFCRVGGGIYTKAADVGADLVGKVEAGIPEDDARNPAVIADNVGDNVGDVAGMGSDLFESYVGCIVSALLLAFVWGGETGIPFVLLIVGSGIVASILGILAVRLFQAKDAQASLNIGTYLSAIILIGAALAITLCLMDTLDIFWAIISGIIAGLLIGKLTEIYTSEAYRPVKNIAASCKTGAATDILSGIAYGMKSTAMPIIVLAGVIIVSYIFADSFGIAMAAVGMLATVGMVVSVDSYGPVADNAGGIAQMTHQNESVRNITDHLDSVGNTTAAIGKGFSIGSAALTALALFASYNAAVGLNGIDILNPNVMAGLFLGAMLAYLFSGLTISSVSRAADKMVAEVRDQFNRFPGIMKGEQTPDYAKCVDISTQAAIREMIIPGIIAIVSPILVGLILGPEALGGLLAGATVAGVLLAIKMANAGGAWDNAKKLIESGDHGGKGSEAHKAAVIGDTVGDPLKDTAGPSLNILIKLMSIVALLFYPLFI